MTRYVLRRILWGILLLILVSALTFVLFRILPTAEPARLRAMAAPAERRQDVCEHESVRLSLDNLMTFPWIATAISAGRLKLHGCFFDIRSGILERLGGDGIFRAIAD